MKEDQFLRDFTSRQHPELIFFLGAGASKSSGIPTAWELTWYFKRDIYCSTNNVSQEALKDVTLSNVQKTIQDWIAVNFPVVDSNEYAFFFERAYPTSQSRKRIINKYVSGASVSIGYLCLGALIKSNKIRNLTTTNFDSLVEKVYPDIFVVSDESSHRAVDLEIAGTKVQLIKLHGDFRYDKLRNTPQEIQHINSEIQSRLKDFFKEFGIVVVGYSGRDDSIMAFFEELAEGKNIFSKGFYWCFRKEDTPNQRVSSLISKLNTKNVEADYVEIESFDDFLVHLYRQTGIKDETIGKTIKERYEQRIPFYFDKSNNGRPPAIMTNSICIEEYPTTAYKFETDINSWVELEGIMKSHDIVASLSKGLSIIAIGNRSKIESVFSGHIKKGLEVVHVLEEHLDKLNTNHGFVYKIFYDIFNNYFEAVLKLRKIGKRTFLNTNRYEIFDSKWLREKYFCYHVFSYGLEFRARELFLILKPSVIPQQNHNTIVPSEISRIITNEFLSTKYNSAVRQILDEWLNILKNSKQRIEISFPSNIDPPSARFVLNGNYSYSLMRQ